MMERGTSRARAEGDVQLAGAFLLGVRTCVRARRVSCALEITLGTVSESWWFIFFSRTTEGLGYCDLISEIFRDRWRE